MKSPECYKKNFFHILYCLIIFAMLCAPLATVRTFPGAAVNEAPASNGAAVGDTVNEASDVTAFGDAVNEASDVTVFGDPIESKVLASGAPPVPDFTALGDAYEKGFGLRRQLIALDSAMRGAVFGESSNSRVTLGKSDWLYYSETLDANSPANNCPERLPPVVARTLSLVNEYLTANGVYFALAAAPNKASVYPEFLPYYTPDPNGANQGLAPKLYKELEAMGVPYIDLKQALLAQKSANANAPTDTRSSFTPTDTSAPIDAPTPTDTRSPYPQPDANEPSYAQITGRPLYLARDTHWNNVGAMIAYREIAGRVAGEMHKRGVECQFDAYESAEAAPARDWLGDLDIMLDPDARKRDTQYYYNIERCYDSKKPIVSYDDMEITTASGANGVRLMMFRDSFANALIPLISNNFGEAAYLRSVPYAFNRAVARQYDAVVLEIVERNLPLIAENAPVVPAPRRIGLESYLSGAETPGARAGLSVEVSRNGSLDKITGFFDPDELTGALAQIFLVLSAGAPSPDGYINDDYYGGDYIRDDEKYIIYEAFPFPDADVRQNAAGRYGAAAAYAGFTAYIDYWGLPDGEYSVGILIPSQSGGYKYVGSGDIYKTQPQD